MAPTSEGPVRTEAEKVSDRLDHEAGNLHNALATLTTLLVNRGTISEEDAATVEAQRTMVDR